MFQSVSQFQDIWCPVKFSTVENCSCRWGTSQRILAKNNIRQHLGPRYLYTARPSDGNGFMDISMVLVPGMGRVQGALGARNGHVDAITHACDSFTHTHTLDAATLLFVSQIIPSRTWCYTLNFLSKRPHAVDSGLQSICLTYIFVHHTSHNTG